MNALNLLYNFVFLLLGGLIVYVLKPFFGSYSAKKGENLATKEDIAQITKAQEDIKAQISDYVWDRQEQWKLRRDSVIEVIRDISSVRGALSHVPGAFKFGSVEDQKEKSTQFYECFSRFFCSKFVAEIVTCNDLTVSLDEFQQLVGKIFEEIINGEPEALRDNANQRAFAEKTNAVLRAARKELGIKTKDDLSLF